MLTRAVVRFASNNTHKIAEASAILAAARIKVVAAPLKLEEMQTTDTSRLVRDKVLKAYGSIGRPLFVEHTGLSIDALNGFPGGLTQIFWDSLKADRFAELFGHEGANRVVARTLV